MSTHSPLNSTTGSAPIQTLPADLVLPILLNVPIRDILVSVQRVCKHWHAFILDSKPLQEALHVRSVTAQPLKLNSPANLSSTTPVELIYHGKTSTGIIVHPVLGSFLWDNTFELNTAALSNPKASWRGALATQPAVKTLRNFGVRVEAKDMTVGVTVQDVVDAMGWEKEGWECEFVRYDRDALHRPRWHLDVAWEFHERIEGIVDVKAEDASGENEEAD